VKKAKAEAKAKENGNIGAAGTTGADGKMEETGENGASRGSR
jgi:hypothetical protein